jgi:hypothetical protein
MTIDARSRHLFYKAWRMYTARFFFPSGKFHGKSVSDIKAGAFEGRSGALPFALIIWWISSVR